MPLALKKTVLTEQDDNLTDEIGEIIAGLSKTPKSISPKFFYDERGSELFDTICELPEYYLTRTELAIMRKHIGEIAERIGPDASLIEFGSGASLKIRILLENLDHLAAYVPVDISKEFLITAADSIQADFPHIEVLPVAADFMHPFDLPAPKITPVKNVVYFPGSTIGNFSPEAAAGLLRVMHHEAGAGGALLIGIDRQKDLSTLESAYNDKEGVTAEFNLNVLRRINRDFGGNFVVENFGHRAVYNEDFGRIEMHLDSTCEQVVTIANQKFTIHSGESLLTEHSHKYTIEGFAQMAEEAGFRLEKVWNDANDWFSIVYCSRN